MPQDDLLPDWLKPAATAPASAGVENDLPAWLKSSGGPDASLSEPVTAPATGATIQPPPDTATEAHSRGPLEAFGHFIGTPWRLLTSGMNQGAVEYSNPPGAGNPLFDPGFWGGFGHGVKQAWDTGGRVSAEDVNRQLGQPTTTLDRIGDAVTQLADPFAWAAFGAPGKLGEIVNAGFKAASGAELLTQGANLAQGKPIDKTNTALAALPFGLEALGALRNVGLAAKAAREAHMADAVKAAEQTAQAQSAAEVAGAMGAGAEPWQQTLADFAGPQPVGKGQPYMDWLARQSEHEDAIRQALAEGKSVAPEVMADYGHLRPGPALPADNPFGPAATEADAAAQRTQIAAGQEGKPNLRTLHGIGKGAGLDHAGLRALAGDVYGVDSLTKLTSEQANDLALHLRGGRTTAEAIQEALDAGQAARASVQPPLSPQQRMPAVPLKVEKPGLMERAGVGLDNVVRAFQGRGTAAMEPVRQLWNRIVIGGQHEDLAALQPVMEALERQVNTEAQAVAAQKGISLPEARQQLFAEQFARSRVATGAFQPIQGDVDFGVIQPGATSYDTIQNIARALGTDEQRLLAALPYSPEFNPRAEYIPLRGKADYGEGPGAAVRRALGMPERPVQPSREVLAGQANPFRGYLKPQESETVEAARQGFANQGRRLIEDSTEAMASRAREQIQNRRMVEFLTELSQQGDIVLPARRAAEMGYGDWVDMANLTKDPATQRLLAGWRVNPEAARFLEGMLARPELGGLRWITGPIGKLQNLYRSAVFYNPAVHGAKNLGSNAALAGLPLPGAAEMAEAAAPGFQGAKDELLRAGVLRGAAPPAEAWVNRIQEGAGTASPLQKLAHANRDLVHQIEDAYKLAGYRHLVQQGMAPAEAAVLVGQAYGNPNLLRTMAASSGNFVGRNVLHPDVANLLALTPQWTANELGFVGRMAAERPAAWWALQRYFPNQVQHALTGTDMSENPAGHEGHVRLTNGPQQTYLYPQLPARALLDLVQHRGDYLKNRLAPVPRALLDASEADSEARQQDRRLPLPPGLQERLDEARKVPLFGRGYYGIGPEVSPGVQAGVSRLVPLLPEQVGRVQQQGWGPAALQALTGMYLSDYDTGRAQRGLRGDIRQARTQIKYATMRKAQAQGR